MPDWTNLRWCGSKPVRQRTVHSQDLRGARSRLWNHLRRLRLFTRLRKLHEPEPVQRGQSVRVRATNVRDTRRAMRPRSQWLRAGSRLRRLRDELQLHQRTMQLHAENLRRARLYLRQRGRWLRHADQLWRLRRQLRMRESRLRHGRSESMRALSARLQPGLPSLEPLLRTASGVRSVLANVLPRCGRVAELGMWPSVRPRLSLRRLPRPLRMRWIASQRLPGGLTFSRSRAFRAAFVGDHAGQT